MIEETGETPCYLNPRSRLPICYQRTAPAIVVQCAKRCMPSSLAGGMKLETRPFSMGSVRQLLVPRSKWA